MYRSLLTRRQLIKLGLVSAVAPRLAFARTPQKPWSFAVCSDTHFGVAGNYQKNEPLLAEIARLQPDFLVVCGDLTERAWPEEFDEAKRAFSALPFPVHVAPGNHDVRWAPGGPVLFSQRIGPVRQLIKHKDCAFLLLDSTVPLSHFGHIGGPQERWVSEQLSTLEPDTPVFVFMHHPVGRSAGIDDDYRLLRALGPANTRILFTAHGHSDLIWDWHGITTTMGRGLYQGSYQFVTVDPEAGTIRVQRRTSDTQTLTDIAQVSLLNKKRTTVAVAVPEETPPTGRLRKMWETPLGGGVMAELVVADDVVYASGMDGVLYAVNARTGAMLWQGATRDYLHSTPMIAGDRVIVGSADGSVYAFRRKDGKLLWRVPTEGPVYGSAAVANGIAAIASGDGCVYGISADTGEVRWRYTLDPGPSAFVQSPAVTDGKRFYLGAWDQNVYALDVQTGKEVWRYLASDRGFYFSAAIARPALHGERLFIPSNDNTLHCIDTQRGAAVWKQNAPGDKFGYSSPVFHNNRVYIGSLGDRGEVHCLDAETGSIVWTTATSATIYESSPAIVGEHLVIGSVNGLLTLLQQRDGAVAGTYKFPAGLFLSVPAASDNRVYAATFAEKLVALEVK